MSYVDLNTIHNPATGTVPPATWGDGVRDNFEFLIDPPACSVYNSAAQSVANTTFTALTANSENFDNDGMHSTSTNTSRITIQTDGRYQFSTVINSAPSISTSFRIVQFKVNNTTTYQVFAMTGSNSGTIGTDISASRSLSLVATDYVEVIVWQNTGAANDITLVEFYAKFITR